MCQNVPCQQVPVSKIPCAKEAPCRNVPVLKHQSAEMSAAPNGAHAEMFPRSNICAKMTLAEMFYVKMVYWRMNDRHFINMNLVCLMK